jgi:hypothetical protein
MGLDMYLDGRRFLFKEQFDENGDKIRMINVDLGYWRKNYNLHTYIIDQFAEGVDDRENVELQVRNIQQILEALRNGEIEEDEVEKNTDIAIFEHAIEWLTKVEGDKNEFRSIIYQASW